jgi:ribosomal protein S18 acetylase RimI-like enzyme
LCISTALQIRAATREDRDAVWEIFHSVVSPGDTYAFDPQMPRKDALAYWFRKNTRTYVAEQESAGDGASVQGKPTASPASARGQQIVGTYILRPNQEGGGAHVANAAFMVAPDAQGRGIGRSMGEHCLKEARRLGFRAMQFNFVISTNDPAVRLWKELGFQIVGTLPSAFHHPQKGYVDVYVMFRSLLPTNRANKHE